MTAKALLSFLLFAAAAAGQGTKGAPPPSAPDEVYRIGRDALARGSFDVAARLFRALEDEPSVSGSAGYAFNRAQAARFLAEAGEAVFWYGRYLALAPQAPDAGTVRELASKLIATHPGAVRSEVVKRSRLAWRRQLEDGELDRALRSCPEVKLEVRFAVAGAVLGGTAYGFPGRIVYWDLPDGDAPATMWIAPTATVAPPEELGGSPFLVLPAGRAIAVPVGPDLVSPPVTVAPQAPEGSISDPALAAARLEITARVELGGPSVFLVARRLTEALLELRSTAADGPLAVGKKRRDAPSEPMSLAFGPRAARAEGKNVPKGLLAPVVLPLRDGTLQAWCAPLTSFDVVNRFGLRTEKAGAARIWVRGEEAGPYLPALGK